MDITFTNETVIDLPREKAVVIFKKSENLHLWQLNIVSYKLLSDPLKDAHDIAEITYSFGGRNLTYLMTTLKDDLPDLQVSTYEIEGMRKIVEVKFELVSKTQCKLVSQSTYTSTDQKFIDDPEYVTASLANHMTEMHNNFKKLAEAQP